LQSPSCPILVRMRAQNFSTTPKGGAGGPRMGDPLEEFRDSGCRNYLQIRKGNTLTFAVC
jgi:hypothetical protein